MSEEIKPRPEVMEANRLRAEERVAKLKADRLAREHERYAIKKDEINAKARARRKAIRESKVRSLKTKLAFARYIDKHPDERFWQSVRNFAEVGFVYVSDERWEGEGLNDTFHREEL